MTEIEAVRLYTIARCWAHIPERTRSFQSLEWADGAGGWRIWTPDLSPARRDAAYYRAYNARRRALGLCIQCGYPSKTSRCSTCNTINAHTAQRNGRRGNGAR